MSDNYFIHVFRKFHESIFRIETFMFRVCSMMRVAGYHFSEEEKADELEDRELLGRISLIWDVTAKDNASQVANNLHFEMYRKEFPEHMELMLSREAARNLATTMEYFEGFLKDTFSALLCYDDPRATILGFEMPTIVPSWEQVRELVSKHKISIKPFENRTSGTAIRKWLLKEFSTLKAFSESDNIFSLDYTSLLDALINLRHDITHRDHILGGKTINKLSLIREYMTVIETNGQFLIQPTEQQVMNVSAKVLEYAFTIAKALSMHYGLSYGEHTYSNKPDIMLHEGKWPLGS